LSIGGWCEPLASDSRCIDAKKASLPAMLWAVPF
jgi:hypothetical protein